MNQMINAINKVMEAQDYDLNREIHLFGEFNSYIAKYKFVNIKV